MAEAASASRYNTFEKNEGSTLGIIACGIAYNYVKENHGGETDILKVSQYPVPEEQVRLLAQRNDAILVIEDGQPVVEEQVKGLVGAGYSIKGRLTGDLPRTGELNPDNVAKALGKPCGPAFDKARNLAGRPPQLCQGCGHRDVFTALKEVLAGYEDYRIFGDIGCYTLGALPPFKALAELRGHGSFHHHGKGCRRCRPLPFGRRHR
jgi:Indolepyruvate ferredoxin oxidoreductase, alpha and beta subunits